MNATTFQWHELEDDLDRLLALDAGARLVELRSIGERDAPRAAALREWLANIARSEGLFESLLARPHGLAAGSPWRLIQPIGSGGMGDVWLAERADGAFERKVAIKFLRADRATLGDRLVLERQLLARLHHPGIAMLLDGGVATSGQPYLVTEWIDGVRLDHWVRDVQPSLRTRVEVLRRITEAVAYAHANLIVHRDLKPANVMVDRDGAPHLLDFGIARLLGEAEGSTLTQDRALTPAFASPEQLSGQPITTRSDVYALGGLLYWLLCGRTPHDTEGLSLAELVRRVCEYDPVTPSAVAGASARFSNADLDAITLKALSRDPAARYPSADALAQDLGRWLDGESVGARLPTRVERVRRFVGRYRLVTALTATIVLALTAGIAGTAWQARVAQAERDVAQAERDQAEQEAWRNQLVRNFLMGMFRPEGDDETKTTPSELLDRAARNAVDLPSRNPDERALLLETLSEIQESRNNPAAALALLDALLAEDAQRLSTAAHARALCARGSVRRSIGKDLDSAEASARDGLAMAEALRGSARGVLVNCLTVLGMVAADRGKFDEAIMSMERAMREGAAWSRGEQLDMMLAITSGLLANAYLYSSRYDDAVREYERGIAMLQKLGRFDSNDGAIAVGSLATAYSGAGRLAEADAQFRRSLEMIDRHAGRNLSYAMMLANHADVEVSLERGEAALESVNEAIAIQTPIVGETGNVQGRALIIRGRAHMLLGHYDAARADFDRAEALLVAALGPRHYAVGRAPEQRANLDVLLGRPDQARVEIDAALARYRAAGTAGERALSQALTLDAELELERGDLAGAQRAVDESRRLSDKLLPKSHYQLRWLDALQAAIRQREGRDAHDELVRAADALRAIFGADHSRVRRIEAWMRAKQGG